MRKYVLKLAPLGVAFAMLPVATSAEQASVNIVARARTICTVTLPGTQQPLQAGQNNFGRMTELCNNIDGYRLVLAHPRGLVGAAVLLDGQRVAISPDANQTVIVDRNYPAYQERQLALELASAAPTLPLTIFAEPKGVVF